MLPLPEFRRLNVIDALTRECLDIRLARKLKPTDLINVPMGLFAARGAPVDIRSYDGLAISRH